MKRLYYKVKRFLNSAEHVRQLERRLKYEMRHQRLVELMISCHESGVSDQPDCEHPVIVSLTTYGKRLYDVAATIESIMQGSMKPNGIVLWLGENLKDIPLPMALLNQQKRGLEVAFCKDIRSYKKLVPTLCRYPDAAVITIDDDLVYDYDLVEKLVYTHKAHPHHIVANRIHRVVLGANSKPLGYMQWKMCDTPKDDLPLNFSTGVGGTLYPPHSLHPEVVNEAVFTDICPFADDVWFYAMALMAGTRVMKCYTHSDRGEDYMLNESVQDVGLCRINTTKKGDPCCANDIQLRAVFNRYNLWDKLTAH